jgi:hypothetical protein
MVAEAESAGGIVLALGVATIDLIGHPSPPAGGFAFSGIAASFTVTESPSAGSYTLTGISAGYTRDFINWVKDGFAGTNWSGESVPSSNWAAANSQASSWQNESGPATNWTPAATPSTAWTVDPTQAIPPPVSN